MAHRRSGRRPDSAFHFSRARSTVVQAAVLALLLHTAAAAAQAVPAATAVAEQTYDIPAGSLSPALSRFAGQVGVTLSSEPALTDGRSTPGLRGRYGVHDGFAQLLAGTGLQIAQASDKVFVLRRVATTATTTALAQVEVRAKADATTTEHTGSYTTGSMSAATGLPLSIRETPQSVSVITRQRIEDQRLETLDDALRATTGMTSTYNGSERALWYSRGERVETLQIDGLPMSVGFVFSSDSLSLPATVLYDHVEVVRGANGLLQGSGSPSAAINLVRKRPTRERQVEVALSAGSWANRTAQVDASGPLNEAGTLRARGVVYANKANSFRDAGSKDNQLLYGILEADLTPDTTLMGGLVWQDDNTGGYDWGGLSTRVDGSFYPFAPSTTLTPGWAYLDKRNKQIFGELTHRFNDDWKLTLAASKVDAKSDMLGRSTRHLSLDNSSLQMRATQLNYDDASKNLGVQLQGAYELFGRRHEVMAGANLQESDWFYSSASVGAYQSFDPLSFSPDSIPAPSNVVNVRSHEGSHKKDSGIYLATRFDLPASNKLIVGGRFSWVDYNAYYSWSDEASRYKATREFTPYLGLVHDLNASTSLYASYTEIFKPQSNIDANGQLLPAVIGSNYELGVKGALLGGALNASAAVFQTEQTNLPRAVAAGERCSTPAVTCYEAADKVRNRGVELDVSGELARGWQVAAGYTYNQSQYVSGNGSGTAYNTYLPRQLLKLSTTWRLPADLHAWKVGANLQAQSGIYQDQTTTAYQSYGGVAYRIEQKSYALVGLMAAYQINRQAEVQLNVNNLFNKQYYTTIGGTNWGNFMGAPRSGAVTLRMRF
ncbi:TonB-dependent siderophore receptor [Xylophilus sp. GW821-FHT01B05]